MDVSGLWIALLSAGVFSLSASLQHHANGDVAAHLSPLGHMVVLLRHPRWMLGQALSLVAFGLHAWALQVGLLVVVQPAMVSGIVLAVPMRAALERRAPHRVELATVIVTAVGLALFLVSAHPSAPTDGRPSTATAAALAGGGVVAAAVAFRWGRGRRGGTQAAGFGLAAGILFGLIAGLVKLAGAGLGDAHGIAAELAALASSWAAWAVPVAGTAAVLINQRAYRAGRLSASMPLLNAIDVVVAIVFGLAVFGELPAHEPWSITGQAVGLALMVVGLRWLAREHVLEGVADDVGVDRSRSMV